MDGCHKRAKISIHIRLTVRYFRQVPWRRPDDVRWPIFFGADSDCIGSTKWKSTRTVGWMLHNLDCCYMTSFDESCRNLFAKANDLSSSGTTSALPRSY